jgi:hypothetical protein
MLADFSGLFLGASSSRRCSTSFWEAKMEAEGTEPYLSKGDLHQIATLSL